MSEHKEEKECLTTNGDVPSADTSLNNSKTTSPKTETKSSAPPVEPSPPESSILAPASDLWVGDGPQSTQAAPLADQETERRK
jgi:hypothetical protein